MENSRYLLGKIQDFPHKAGVYLMKDDKGKILYVGKAKDLKKRVTSYFSGIKDLKTEVLINKVADIEVIITRSEMEALLTENSLIKENEPKYNINLKDGKTYPVIRITNEPFPRIFRTRRLVFDGSSYFGPFPKPEEIDTYLALIEKLFPLRKCRGPLKKRAHPCVYYHIGRCSAPCAGLISEEEYAEVVARIKKLLSGESKELEKELKEKMKQAAEGQEFEKAALFRDQLNAVLHISQLQKLSLSAAATNDYIGMAIRDKFASFVVLKVRNGKIMAKELFKTRNYSSRKEALSQFVFQYYARRSQLPQAIYMPQEAEGVLAEALGQKLGLCCRVLMPKRGKHAGMVKMALENAEQDLRITSLDSLVELKAALGLRELPVRIEGFDIAHLDGTHTVASMVCFINGRPEKSAYRKFKIKVLKGAVDDYEAMREVVARRYTRVLNEGTALPDLVLIDGGKGQLNAALEVLHTLGLDELPAAGLAKRAEEIFLPGQEKPLILSRDSLGLKVLQAVRDESHRFATSFHKKLRDRQASLTLLEKYEGIGKVKSRKLLTAFGSLAAIIATPPDELARTAGISKDRAEELIRGLKAELGN
jgi:excinuclease ABC subunit C